MTGWAGPGTNLPLSRITIGSLADMGYTVNYAAADSFTPSSSALSAARTAASASSAAVRLRGLTTSVATNSIDVSTAGVSQSLTIEQPHRYEAALSNESRSANLQIASAIIASATSSPSTTSTADNDCFVETQDSTSTTDQAWAELATDWNAWPAMSLA